MSQVIHLANPGDSTFYCNRYVLALGAYGWTKVMVYADSLEDAIEECAEWCLKNAPGHVMVEWSDEHKELIKEVCKERGISFPEGFEALEDDAKWSICEDAEADLMRTESGFLTSYEVHIVLDCPDRKELKSYLKDSDSEIRI